MPWDEKRGWSVSSRPRPAMWVCMPMRLTWRPRSRDSVVTFCSVKSAQQTDGLYNRTIFCFYEFVVRRLRYGMTRKKKTEGGKWTQFLCCMLKDFSNPEHFEIGQVSLRSADSTLSNDARKAEEKFSRMKS